MGVFEAFSLFFGQIILTASQRTAWTPNTVRHASCVMMGHNQNVEYLIKSVQTETKNYFFFLQLQLDSVQTPYVIMAFVSSFFNCFCLKIYYVTPGS